MTLEDSDTCPFPSSGSENSMGFRVNPVGAEGVFKAVEDVGWDLAAPHATQMASFQLTFDVFGGKGYGGPELQVSEAMTAVWNRVLARNMATTEAMIQVLVTSGRTALAAIAEGDCMMAHEATLAMREAPDVSVSDGM